LCLIRKRIELYSDVLLYIVHISRIFDGKTWFFWRHSGGQSVISPYNGVAWLDLLLSLTSKFSRLGVIAVFPAYGRCLLANGIKYNAIEIKISNEIILWWSRDLRSF